LGDIGDPNLPDIRPEVRKTMIKTHKCVSGILAACFNVQINNKEVVTFLPLSHTHIFFL
jgi:hypothetical protein